MALQTKIIILTTGILGIFDCVYLFNVTWKTNCLLVFNLLKL